MINPISDAYNLFINFWSILPLPIQALVMLAVGLFLISAIVHLVFK